jgi:hypothetical protein
MSIEEQDEVLGRLMRSLAEAKKQRALIQHQIDEAATSLVRLAALSKHPEDFASRIAAKDLCLQLGLTDLAARIEEAAERKSEISALEQKLRDAGVI